MARKSESGSRVEKKSGEEIWIPTGSTLLDLVMGGGRGEGAEAGQVVNFCAPSGAGKTAIVNEIMANAHHRYGEKFRFCYDATTESGNTFDTEELYGFEIFPKDPKKQVRSTTVEQAFANIMMFLERLSEDEFGVYALDSIDAVTSAEIEDIAEEHVKAVRKGETYDKGSYQQGKAKFLSTTFLPKVADMAERKNCLIIIVSQLRDNIGAGPYAAKDKTSNGRALLFYCATQVWFKTVTKIERNGLPIGAVMNAVTKKCRGPRPYRECRFTFYYTYGIDNVGSNLDYLYDLRTAERGELKAKACADLEWDGGHYSRTELIRHIEDNALEEELACRVRAKWEQTEREAVAEIAERKRRF